MNERRCQRCDSRYHTDCEDPVMYSDTGIHYLLIAAVLAIIAVGLILFAITQLLP